MISNFLLLGVMIVWWVTIIYSFTYLDKEEDYSAEVLLVFTFIFVIGVLYGVILRVFKLGQYKGEN